MSAAGERAVPRREGGLRLRGLGKGGPWVAFAAAVLAALFFHLALPERFAVNDSTDYLGNYEPIARNILAGKGFVDENGSPAIRYPPGYPIFLAALFRVSEGLGLSPSIALRSFILGATGTAALLVYLVARTAFGPVGALLAALGWSFYPFTLWLTKQPNSEVLFTPLLYGGFYFFWTAMRRDETRGGDPPGGDPPGGDPPRGRVFVAGVFFSAAMLVRPIAMLVPFVLAPFVRFWRGDLTAYRHLQLVFFLLAGTALPAVPWGLWNVHDGNGWIVLGVGGQRAILDGFTFSVRANQEWRKPIDLPDDVERLMRAVDRREAEMKTVRSALRVVADEARQRPLAMVKLLSLKAARSWYATDSRRFDKVILLLQIPFAVLFLVSARAAWRLGGEPRKMIQGATTVVVYFWLMNLVSNSLLRYMTPAIGLLFLALPALGRCLTTSPSGTPRARVR